MTYFIVKYLHTDLDGWNKFLEAHIAYLNEQVNQHKLIVSGPVKDSHPGKKEAFLIFQINDKAELLALLKQDPYWYEGLVADYSINQWQPMFGDLQHLEID